MELYTVVGPDMVRDVSFPVRPAVPDSTTLPQLTVDMYFTDAVDTRGAARAMHRR